MEDIKSLKSLLSQVKSLASVTDAVIMTKTGMFILGSLRRSTSMDKFVGMAAILMGSAEAASMEMEDPVKGVVIRLNNQKIVFMSVTEDLLLAVIFRGKRADDTLLEEIEQLIAEQ
ncbi:MAG: roadblock/LC7 domain-containing protein [Methanomassiliicoccales archaeon]|nr:MAG: roadblock/LC7 domain-containing protein [Methanomassiliicoccales archaeon]